MTRQAQALYGHTAIGMLDEDASPRLSHVIIPASHVLKAWPGYEKSPDRVSGKAFKSSSDQSHGHHLSGPAECISQCNPFHQRIVAARPTQKLVLPMPN
jgi:hypothetical protein